MGSYLENELAAAKLRQQLHAAYSNELKLLAGLRFFDRFASSAGSGLEAYLREFAAPLAALAPECDPAEFLPEDAHSLSILTTLLQPFRLELGLTQECSALAFLEQKIVKARYLPSHTEASPPADISRNRSTVPVTCLFVEDYFYLGLEGRGRLLALWITAEPRSPGEEPDEIDLHNAVDSETDPFIEQARDSILAARACLTSQFGLSPRKRYHFDIVVNHRGARFTGDSLGVAIAVGAIAAVTQIEPFRRRLRVSSQVAITGALSSAGRLTAISPEGLQKKIHRAFFSSLKRLVVPREHLDTSREYLKTLEESHPDRPASRLDIVGAERLEEIIGDPELVRVEPVSLPVYLVRKLRHRARSPWLEVPALIVLLAILVYLFGGKWLDPDPARVATNVSTQSLEVFNSRGDRLWSYRLDGPFKPDTYLVKLQDLDADGKSEILWMPITTRKCSGTNTLFCFEPDGTLRFSRSCVILNRYPNDTLGFTYDNTHLNVVENRGKKLIITEIAASNPGRGHIRLWNSQGDSLGWYVNAGATCFFLDKDIDGDGSHELLFENYNNRMKCAALLVLRSDSVRGVSPPYVDSTWDLAGVVRGNQIAYVLFPQTDLSVKLTNLPYNQPTVVGVYEKSAGSLRLHTCEAGLCEAMYDMDYRFRVKQASFSDQFLKKRNDLLSEGKLQPIPWNEYERRTLSAVTYWTDSGWVTEGQLQAAGK